MKADVHQIIDVLVGSSYYQDEIDNAIAQLTAVATVLDGIKAEYDAKMNDGIITINVEPMLSYDRVIFKIDIRKRTITKTENGELDVKNYYEKCNN